MKIKEIQAYVLLILLAGIILLTLNRNESSIAIAIVFYTIVNMRGDEK